MRPPSAWEVRWSPRSKQWACIPPEWVKRDGEWVILTNVHTTFWPTRDIAWNRARANAKKDRCQALLYNKAGIIIDHPDYTTTFHHRPRGHVG